MDGGGEEKSHWLKRQPWIVRWGLSGWLLLGIVAMLVVAWMAYNKAHQVVLPLAIAIIVGLLLEPLVELMVRHRFPRWLAVVLTMLLIVAVLGGIMTMIVYGIVTQAGAIERQAQEGVRQLRDWFDRQEINPSVRSWISEKIDETWPQVQDALTRRVTATIPGLASFLLGMLIGFFIVIFLLGDDGAIKSWVAGHLGVARERGEAILDEVTNSVRGYFKGTTIIATVNALAIIPVALILKVPLVAPISLVTFVTCYIPSFGGYIGGAFAALITVASQGLVKGLIMLAFVAFSHTVLQGPVQAYAYGKTLKIHPLVALLVTLLGAVFAGIAGAVLAVPVTAVSLKVNALIRQARLGESEGEGEKPPPGGGAGAPLSPQAG